jgi:hypothetical protein
MRIEDDTKSKQARQELVNRLRGVRTPPNRAMSRGIAFEDDVCSCCDGKYYPRKEEYDACVRETAVYVQDALRQVHVDVELLDDLHIHGYIDFLLPGAIVDTKTTAKYKFGKYCGNAQHLAYLSWGAPLGITRFAYIIMDFQNMTVTREEYFWAPKMRDNLRSKALTFLDYLKHDAEMDQAFTEHKPFLRGK